MAKIIFYSANQDKKQEMHYAPGVLGGSQVNLNAYDPNQPRDPKGSSTGGQWTSGGSKYNNGKPYYRYTSNPDNPMSQWGHAMFADEKDKVSEHHSYGHNAWTFSPENGDSRVANIEDLKEKTRVAWKKTADFYNENGWYQSVGGGEDLKDFLEMNLEFDEVFSYLNPEDIVNTAEGWDGDLGIWFYHAVAEPNDIGAIITEDGAIVWDRNMIIRTRGDDW